MVIISQINTRRMKLIINAYLKTELSSLIVLFDSFLLDFSAAKPKVPFELLDRRPLCVHLGN